MLDVRFRDKRESGEPNVGFMVLDLLLPHMGIINKE